MEARNRRTPSSSQLSPPSQPSARLRSCSQGDRGYRRPNYNEDTDDDDEEQGKRGTAQCKKPAQSNAKTSKGASTTIKLPPNRLGESVAESSSSAGNLSDRKVAMKASVTDHINRSASEKSTASRNGSQGNIAMGPGTRQLARDSVFALGSVSQDVDSINKAKKSTAMRLPQKEPACIPPIHDSSTALSSSQRQAPATIDLSETTGHALRPRKVALDQNQKVPGDTFSKAPVPRQAHRLKFCPFCDDKMPRKPSQSLCEMMQPWLDRLHAKKPIGVTEVLATCAKHREEEQIIPQGKRAGWPTELIEAKLKARLQEGTFQNEDHEQVSFRQVLEAIVEQPRSSVLMQQALKDRENSLKSGRRSGLNAISPQNTQAGYYGELGWEFCRSVVTRWFVKDHSATSGNQHDLRSSAVIERIKPLRTFEFVDTVLVPELICRLIMDDYAKKQGRARQDLSWSQAMEIRRDSHPYGLAMFPSESGSADDLLFSQSPSTASMSRTSQNLQSTPKGARRRGSQDGHLPERNQPKKCSSRQQRADANRRGSFDDKNDAIEISATHTPRRARPKARAAQPAAIGSDEDDDSFFARRSIRGTNEHRHSSPDTSPSVSGSPSKKRRTDEATLPPGNSNRGLPGPSNDTIDLSDSPTSQRSAQSRVSPTSQRSPKGRTSPRRRASTVVIDDSPDAKRDKSAGTVQGRRSSKESRAGPARIRHDATAAEESLSEPSSSSGASSLKSGPTLVSPQTRPRARPTASARGQGAEGPKQASQLNSSPLESSGDTTSSAVRGLKSGLRINSSGEQSQGQRRSRANGDGDGDGAGDGDDCGDPDGGIEEDEDEGDWHIGRICKSRGFEKPTFDSEEE